MLTSVLAEVHPALYWPISFCVFSSVTTYVLSVITSNVSQVDRVWTFLPTIYTAYFALLPLWPSEYDVRRLWDVALLPYTPLNLEKSIGGEFSPRALLMLALVTIWMWRLSYNTWRRGLFNLNDEDYRWGVLRQKLHPILFQIFNITFISFIQNVLLLSLGLPTFLAAIIPHEPLTRTDYTLFASGLVLLAVEFTADNQQWAYQNFKHAFLEQEKEFRGAVASLVEGEGGEFRYKPKLPKSAYWPFAVFPYAQADAHRGFITRGLWGWSRHPNFLCEQSFWMLITLFPVLSLPPGTDKVAIALAFVPALSLSSLFVGSTIFTESITAAKYPEAYGAYRRRVGMFLPVPWGWVVGEKERKRGDEILWGKSKKE